MAETRFPDFFAAAPSIVIRDPLAEFLGAVADGLIEYRYADAVRLAGHSCPTVASAFLMARRALGHLYGSSLPERGAIRVDARERAENGVTGVVANVFGLLTGAAESGGFAGLAGRFRRRNLLSFQAPIDGEFRFTRLDNGKSVDVTARLEHVPGDARTAPLMAACLNGVANDDDVARFHQLWQDRVRRLLTLHADDPNVFPLRSVA